MFLQKMSSGDYIGIKLKANRKINTYQLYTLGEDADPNIRRQVKSLSMDQLNNFKKIGTKFPDFNFQDLEGNTFTNSNLNGKTIVLKTWFIVCKA